VKRYLGTVLKDNPGEEINMTLPKTQEELDKLLQKHSEELSAKLQKSFEEKQQGFLADIRKHKDAKNALQDQLEGLGDVEELKRLAKEARTRAEEDDLSKGNYEKLTQQLKEQHAKQVADLQRDREQLESTLFSEMVGNRVGEGVRELDLTTGVPFEPILRQDYRLERSENGYELVRKDGRFDPKAETAGVPLSVNSAMREMVEQDAWSGFVRSKANGGTGRASGDGDGGGGSTTVLKWSDVKKDPSLYKKHAEAIASGTMRLVNDVSA